MGVISRVKPGRKTGTMSRVMSRRRKLAKPPTISSEQTESIDSEAIAEKMSPYKKPAETDESDEDPESRKADFSPQIGVRRIEVQSTPSEARVYVDDVKMGTTPMFIEVLDDEIAVVRVSLKGHRSVTLDIGPDDCDSDEMVFVLERY